MSGKANGVREAPAAGLPRPDRRADRHAATRTDIVEAAWDLVREQGLAGLSMRDLGDRVGMRAQSVYSYFGSKTDILDAMFRQGYEDYLAVLGPLVDADPSDTARYLRRIAHGFFDFCIAEPGRFQLLFLRTVPGFEPSPESYDVAIVALAKLQGAFDRIGLADPQTADLATAMMTGLASQQLANDPGGDRWERLVDRSVDMLLAETAPHLHPNASVRTGRTGS